MHWIVKSEFDAADIDIHWQDHDALIVTQAGGAALAGDDNDVILIDGEDVAAVIDALTVALRHRPGNPRQE